MTIKTTALYAGVLSIIILLLATRVMRLRWQHKVGIGDAGVKELARAVRVHANAIEYVPLAVILMAFAESLGATAVWMHFCGGALVLSRVIHAIGLSRRGGASFGRMVGTLITASVMLGLAIAVMVMAVH